jgi:hypothetical protein
MIVISDAARERLSALFVERGAGTQAYRIFLDGFG